MNWNEIVDSPEATPPPKLSLRPEEKDECVDRAKKQQHNTDKLQLMMEAIGVYGDGWAPNDEFEAAKERARLMKNEIMKAAETEEETRQVSELWPFQDHEEGD